MTGVQEEEKEKEKEKEKEEMEGKFLESKRGRLQIDPLKHDSK